MGFSTLVHIPLPLWSAPEFSLVCSQISADCIVLPPLVYSETPPRLPPLVYSETPPRLVALPGHSTAYDTALHTTLIERCTPHSTPLHMINFSSQGAIQCHHQWLFMSGYRQFLKHLQRTQIKLHMEWSSQSSLKKITLKMRIQILYKPSLSLSLFHIHISVYMCICACVCIAFRIQMEYIVLIFYVA